MDNATNLLKKKSIIGNLFLLTNKLQVVMDSILAPYDVTAKQWFLTAVLEEFFGTPPTLSELSDAMSNSRQNVKQLVDNLEKKLFLEMEKDEHDRRAIRVKLTEKYFSFCKEIEGDGDNFIKETFEDLTEEEIDTTCRVIAKLSAKLAKPE